MEEKGIGRGGDRRFSMPESGGGRKFSLSESVSANKDEEKVKSKSSKVRVYDKVSQPGKISPLIRIAALEKAINNLLQPTIEGVQQHSDLIQYKLTELSLKKQNEMLQEELDSTKCLLEKQNQRAEESIVENLRLNKQVEELSKKFGQLQETHVKILQEKEEQRMELESLNADLQDQVSSVAAAKMFLEEETNSLQSEMDRRTLVSEEEKVNLKGTLRELERSLDSVKKDLESSRAMEEKKEGQIVELRHQLLDLRHELLDNADAKTCLEQKNNCLITEMNKCREENALLQGRITELETALNCVKKDLESKDVRLREMTERESLQVKIVYPCQISMHS
jgi:chromosome segregation ATPase